LKIKTFEVSDETKMHANRTHFKSLAYSSVNCVTSLCYASGFDLKKIIIIVINY